MSKRALIIHGLGAAFVWGVAMPVAGADAAAVGAAQATGAGGWLRLEGVAREPAGRRPAPTRQPGTRLLEQRQDERRAWQSLRRESRAASPSLDAPARDSGGWRLRLERQGAAQARQREAQRLRRERTGD
ncbi:hypothetical protein [Marichromatium bheemlicum]|uniref:Uncharacterized protein n=1 Tax=Marichromatium bheemlicum TaxID=365339 RepID=A0ABX1I500_9GAMM|nr:hypothetical protein [Marichromatium bheemlicum]NKN32084.1 hypothetical protein [Marichromatium bheemlicum]